MGWWSEEILGGDIPQDAIIDMQEIARINTDKLHNLPANSKLVGNYGFTRTNIRAHFRNLVNFCDRQAPGTGETNIAFQTLGELCILTQTPLTKNEKLDFLSYKKDPDIKNWGDPKERRAKLKEWVEGIEALPSL
ncbi:MAG TPA: hypothetical protein DCW93_02035 [Saprospirales bacterium]|nr:hypothetical protein [Saprospirales bacterium]